MSSDARLILKRTGPVERWVHSEHGDYDVDRFDKEFSDQLYSARGREIVESQSQRDAQDDRQGRNGR